MIQLLGMWYGVQNEDLWKKRVRTLVMASLKLIDDQYPGDSELWENNKARIKKAFQTYYLTYFNFEVAERTVLCGEEFSEYCP